MAKGPYLTRKIKELIANIYFDDRQIKPAKARELLLKRMRAEGLDEIFGSNFPSVSTVSKELKGCRDKDEARSPESKELDKPWSIGRIAAEGYDIPPESIPTLLELQEYRANLRLRFTVRDAWWASRLLPLIKPRVLPPVQVLHIWVKEYSDLQEVAELTGTDFDTSELDEIIKKHAETFAAYPTYWERLSRQKGFEYTAQLLEKVMDIRYQSKQRQLTENEKQLVKYTEEWDGGMSYRRVMLAVFDADTINKLWSLMDKLDQAYPIGEGRFPEFAEHESQDNFLVENILGDDDADFYWSCWEETLKKLEQEEVWTTLEQEVRNIYMGLKERVGRFTSAYHLMKGHLY